MSNSANIGGHITAKTIDNQSLEDILEAYNHDDLIVDDGTASSPAIKFTNDLDTGLYRVGTDNIGVSTGGVLRLDVDTNNVTSTLALHAPAGTESLPAYSFTGDSNTGIYNPAANTLGIITGSNERVQIGDPSVNNYAVLDITEGANDQTNKASLRCRYGNNSTFYGSSQIVMSEVGTANYSHAIKTRHHSNQLADNAIDFFVWDDLVDANADVGTRHIFTMDALKVISKVPVYASTGAVGAPAYSFESDTNTGLYSVGADNIGISTGGTLRLDVDTSNVTSTLPIDITDTTDATSETTGALIVAGGIGCSKQIHSCGIYIRDTATHINLIDTDDSDKQWHMEINNGGLAFVESSVSEWFNLEKTTGNLNHGGAQIKASAGTESLPAYSFSGDPDTGMYSSAANTIALACQGKDVLTISEASSELVSDSVVVKPLTTLSTTMDFAVQVGNGVGAYTDLMRVDESICQIDVPVDIDVTSSDAFHVRREGNGNTVFKVNTFTDQILMDGSNDPAAPILSFDSDTNTGMYWVGIDHIGWTCGGTKRMALDDTELDLDVPMRLATYATGSLPSGVEGQIAYDTTLNKMVLYTGSGWETVTSS